MAQAITIDGPAGAGKSTAAKRISAKLKIPRINTGLFYRSIAYAHEAEQGITVDNPPIAEVVDWLEEAHPRFRQIGGRMLFDEVDITEACSVPIISANASYVATHEPVRSIVDVLTVDTVRNDPAEYVLSDGRDEARLHRAAGNFALGFYLTAPVEVRAIRAVEDEGQAWLSSALVQVEILRRDLQDMTRAVSPLSPLYDDGKFRLINSANDIPILTYGWQLGIDTAAFNRREDEQDELMIRAIKLIR